VFESPTNPLTKIADIARLTAIARKHGALTVLDNTFAGLHNHGRFDIDVFVHSLTKFASGHGDVMGGAVIARTELIRAMRSDFINMGAVLDPHAAFLIVRGLRTYFVRRREQCASALRIAASSRATSNVPVRRVSKHIRNTRSPLPKCGFPVASCRSTFAAAPGGRRFADALSARQGGEPRFVDRW
jgi:cystathionine beta-lyase/cystathionine gamma-synthase